MKKRTVIFLLLSAHCFAIFGKPLTNSVPLTPLATFALEKHWEFPTNQFEANQPIAFAIRTRMTNDFFCNLPPVNQLFDFHLFDSQGHEVPKTTVGREKSDSLDAKPSKAYAHYRMHYFFGSDIEDWGIPEQLFKIPEPGTYQLEVRFRILLPMTNGVTDYSSITNGTNFAHSHIFGVVTSDTVRVEIVKKLTEQK